MVTLRASMGSTEVGRIAASAVTSGAATEADCTGRTSTASTVASAEGDATTAVVAPRLERIAMAFPPGCPSPLPTIVQPVASYRIERAPPANRTATGFFRANGFLGIRVTVLVDGSKLTDLILIIAALLAMNEPCLPCLTSR